MKLEYSQIESNLRQGKKGRRLINSQLRRLHFEKLAFSAQDCEVDNERII